MSALTELEAKGNRMERQVWKYEIPLRDTFEIDMPADAHILTVATQEGRPCLWVYVDPMEVTLTCRFRLAGTGHAIDHEEILGYLGSFQMAEGLLVFHLFRLRPAPCPR